MSEKTIAEWDAEGLSARQGQQFAQDIQHINALKVFIRTMPKWSTEFNTTAIIEITSMPRVNGVGIEFKFDKKSLTVKEADALTERLIDTSRLMEIEYLVETMRGLGVEPDIINRLVDEGDELAKKLEGENE